MQCCFIFRRHACPETPSPRTVGTRRSAHEITMIDRPQTQSHTYPYTHGQQSHYIIYSVIVILYNNRYLLLLTQCRSQRRRHRGTGNTSRHATCIRNILRRITVIHQEQEHFEWTLKYAYSDTTILHFAYGKWGILHFCNDSMGAKTCTKINISWFT